MFDYSKLKGRIVEKFGTQTAFAKAMGVRTDKITRVLKGRDNFTQKEIFKWCDTLKISAEEIGEYFFSKKVHEM